MHDFIYDPKFIIEYDVTYFSELCASASLRFEIIQINYIGMAFQKKHLTF
jgi:hypothetical protein